MKDVQRKTVRFDDYTMAFINKEARKNGITFSQTVRRILIYIMFKLHENGMSFDDLPLSTSGLSKKDEQLVSKVWVLYSHSASNLNQATHALNQLKSFAWLDDEHDELMSKLNRIHYDLDKVNRNFDRYQDILHVLVSKYNSNNK